MLRWQLLLVVCSLVQVTGQTPCPANSFGEGDGSLCICERGYSGRLRYNDAIIPAVYEGSCDRDDDDVRAELAVVVGVVCSILLASVVTVAVYRRASTRRALKAHGKADTTIPTQPTPQASEMQPLTSMNLTRMSGRMVLSHDGVKTIVRQAPSPPAHPQTPPSGPEEAIPPVRAQTSSHANTLKNSKDETLDRCAKRRPRRKSFEHDEAGLLAIRQALADREAAATRGHSAGAGSASTSPREVSSDHLETRQQITDCSSGRIELHSIVEGPRDEMFVSADSQVQPTPTAIRGMQGS